MENTNRFNHIDFLRAVAIIGIIAIHTVSYSLTNDFNKFIWNYLHFVVPAFVFCSGFVMMKRYKSKFINLKSTLAWYKKRIIRLILPFYIYLLIHYALLYLFPNFFSGLGLQKSAAFLLSSVFLTGGIGLDWLPLLFIELALLFPVLIYLVQNKLIKYYLIFALFITVYFTVYTFPYSYYRYVMWIPWSLILLASMFISELKEKNKSYTAVFKIIITNTLIFILLFTLWHPLNKSFNLIDYKYPPSLYYLSYATATTFIFLLISQLKVWQNKLIKKLYTFISYESYPIFFISYVVLDFTLNIRNKFNILNNIIVMFIVVLTLSLIVAYLSSKFKNIRLNFLPKS